MEHRKPHEIANQLLEARLELRASENLAVETALTERIAELPEDDFCHFTRETLQMGAGYAYLQRKTDTVSYEDIFTVFYSTQPQYRYLDYETVDLERKAISQAAIELLDTGTIPGLESHVDIYRVEAAAAFIEGFVITSIILRSLTRST